MLDAPGNIEPYTCMHELTAKNIYQTYNTWLVVLSHGIYYVIHVRINFSLSHIIGLDCRAEVRQRESSLFLTEKLRAVF